MALVDKLSDLTSFEYKKVGDFESIDSNSSPLTQLPRPDIDTDTSPPEVKGREQALQATSDFLTSPKGALFVVKQQVLQNQNPSEHTRAYKPSSLIETQFEKVPRHTSTGFQGQNPFKSDTPTYEKDVVVNNPEKLKENRYQVKLSLNPKSPNKRSLTVVSRDRTSSGLRLPLTGGAGTESELPKDFIKFYIKDVVGGKMIQFPAYLNDITDNSSAEYNPTRYIGRADQVYVYSGYTRSVSFGFRVAALARGDVPLMWKKVEALKSLTLPAYQDDVIQNDNELRPVAPFVELTIGNYFVNQPGFFSSVNVTIPQNSSWETQAGYQLTHIADVSLEFTYIGKQLPRLTGKQYDIEYEQDYSKQKKKERIEAARIESNKQKVEELINRRNQLNVDTTLNLDVSDTYEDTVRRGRRAEESNPLLNIGRV
jgi:hypothetical protein